MSSQNTLFPRGLLAEMCPLLISGLTDDQIAVELDVEELAVSEYISWILTTLRLANRQELVFMLRGYFQPDARFASQYPCSQGTRR
jgi:Bacterial regulatory proteins, luxR family